MQIRSWGSLALGATFAVGTAASLFWDVRSVSQLTTDHMMTLLVLIGTIASGHMFWHQLRNSLLGCAGLAVLFGAGTIYCVVTSAARNVEIGIPRTLEIVSLNEQRKRLEADIAEAQGDARKAKAAAAKNCADGEGRQCKSLSKLAAAADAHYWVLVARLSTAKPEQPANPGLHHAAQVLALLPLTGSPEALETALVQLMPFAKALFLEIATIVFLGLGLGNKIAHQKGQTARRGHEQPEIRCHQFSISADARTVVEALRTVAGSVTNDELASLMGVTKGEASRRATVALENGLITRERLGREVAISLARKLH